MKIYISGKITGNENAETDFKRGELWAKLNGHRAVNPYNIGMDLIEALTYEEILALDFKLIEICDCVYMLRGWEKSRGAKAELNFAKALGKKIHFESKQWRLRFDSILPKRKMS